METRVGDYVKYKGKVYSVALVDNNGLRLISYKDLEILKNIPRLELKRLTYFHVMVLRYNKELPKRRFKRGDRVKLRAKLDSEGVYDSTFRDNGFEENKEYNINCINTPCKLGITEYSAHEFEIELVEEI